MLDNAVITTGTTADATTASPLFFTSLFLIITILLLTIVCFYLTRRQLRINDVK